MADSRRLWSLRHSHVSSEACVHACDHICLPTIVRAGFFRSLSYVSGLHVPFPNEDKSLECGALVLGSAQRMLLGRMGCTPTQAGPLLQELTF